VKKEGDFLKRKFGKPIHVNHAESIMIEQKPRISHERKICTHCYARKNKDWTFCPWYVPEDGKEYCTLSD
jgi:hypothetical protein